MLEPPGRILTGRLASLDALRGMMLVASVVSNSLLHAPAWYEHAPWDGVHGVDLIFPVFVTITGVGLGFALHRRVAPWPLVRRSAVLFGVGLLYNAVVLWTFVPKTWRITGVLQLYAGVVIILGLLHLITKSWIGWAAITLAFATAHTVILAVWATDCPGGHLTRECNPSGVVDPAVFGPLHIYAQGALGHDPEGLVTLLSALVSASAGATAAHLLLKTRARATAKGRGVAASILPFIGLATALAGAGWLALMVPAWTTGEPMLVMKRLWTAPFALFIAAGTVVLLLLWHVIVDRSTAGRAVQISTYPLIALGRNSLLVYFGSHVVMSLLMHPTADQPSAIEQIWLSLGSSPQVTWSALVLATWVGIAIVLHRKRIYLRP